MEKRTRLKDTREDGFAVEEAAANLLSYIERLNLPTESHNELMEMVDLYRDAWERERRRRERDACYGKHLSAFFK